MLIIPAIDLKKGEIVRLYKGRFDKISYYDIEFDKLVRDYFKAGIKRLHVVLLYAAKTGEITKEEEERIKRILEIREINEIKDCEIQVGGGIRKKSQIEKFFSIGVNYVILGTAIIIPFALNEGYTLQDIRFFYQRSGKKFEIEKELPEIELIDWIEDEIKERIIVSIDFTKDEIALSGWEVTIPIRPDYVIKKLIEKGFKRFLLTNIEVDGTLIGIDIKSLNQIFKNLEFSKSQIKEIIIAGGISKEEDILLLDSLPFRPTGVIIGKALYHKKIDLKNVLQKYQT